MSLPAYVANFMNIRIGCEWPESKIAFQGLARPIRRQLDGGKWQVWPGVRNGIEAEYVGPDDQLHLSGYHRLQGISSNRLPGGYGDNLGRQRVVYRMSLVLFGNIHQLQLEPEEIATRLHSFLNGMLPKESKPPGYEIVTINISDVVLNEEQVFNEEYKNVEYFVGPENLLMKVNYNIESVLSQGCFKTQCPPFGRA